MELQHGRVYHPGMTEEERALTKRYVDIWKQTAVELDRIKCEELRAMTEAGAARVADMLCVPDENIWVRPEHANGAGLVEQQRLFSLLHGRKSDF